MIRALALAMLVLAAGLHQEWWTTEEVYEAVAPAALIARVRRGRRRSDLAANEETCVALLAERDDDGGQP